MHMSPILSVLLIAICCVNYTFASGFGVDCKCTCCISSKTAACKPSDIGSIHLDLASCDNTKCLDACKQRYPLCESGKSIMQTTCSQSEPSSSSTSPSPSSSTATTPTAPWSTTTIQSSTAGSSTSTTPKTGSSTSTTPKTGSSTISTTSSRISTTSYSSANAIKSFSHFSYLILFTIVFTFFRM
ncbi:hypothetical protein I4U23_026766 [Adineta vaga]|nr:hypothetical protein I4U23_026766 [Adineta vaga]